MPKPAQSRASVSIGTSLPATRVIDLAETASRSAEDIDTLVQVRSRSAAGLELALRPLGDTVEIMRFDVQIDRAVGRTTARTVIQAFETKQGGMGGLVPVARRKLLGFPSYVAYMTRLANAVALEDPAASVTVVTGD